MTFRLGYYEAGELGRSSGARRGSSASRSTTRPPTRSPGARGGRRGCPTGSSAASATSPTVRARRRDHSGVAARRWRCSRSTARGSSAPTASFSRPIVHKFGGGPVGLSTLAVSLGEEPDTVEDVYEPYLLELGFIQRTPRGRVITELGLAHVAAGQGCQGGQPVLSPDLWVPGFAGPARRPGRPHPPPRGEAAEEAGVEQAFVEVELADGVRYAVESLSAEPGYGFVTIRSTPGRRRPDGGDRPDRLDQDGSRSVARASSARSSASLCRRPDRGRQGAACVRRPLVVVGRWDGVRVR